MPGWRKLAVHALSVALTFTASYPATALEAGQTESIASRDIYVVDGDTIRVAGVSYRLVGFDAPEVGRTAVCDAEVAKGYDAKARVVDLVWSGRPLTLTRVACSCAPSAPEETFFCNYGRRCGTLSVAGEDVGITLMREGLAKSYPYDWRHVPPKPRWCGG